MDSREPQTAAGKKYEANGVSREYVLTIERQAAEQALRTREGREAALVRAIDAVALAQRASVDDLWTDGFRQGHRAVREAVERFLATDPASPSPAASAVDLATT